MPNDTERYRAVLEDIASEEWRGPMGEIRLKHVIEQACAVLHHPGETCSIQVHRAWRQSLDPHKAS